MTNKMKSQTSPHHFVTLRSESLKRRDHEIQKLRRLCTTPH